MIDLSTTYMGFRLPHPIIPGASPMCDDLDTVRRLEDAGAPMLIMHSVFEEQLIQESLSLNWAMDSTENSGGEASSYFPKPDDFRLGPDAYLKQIAAIKASCKIPLIASLNGHSLGGWIEYAKLIQQAGADGLELNMYDMPLSPDRTAAEIELDTLEVIRAVRDAVSLPLAIKLSPFYTSPINFAKRIDASGVKALVLFNRFYQPDIDLNDLTISRQLKLSNSDELPLRLRWTAALFGQVEASLAITGGVHTAEDIVKSLMVGANAVQMVSALLRFGPQYLAAVKIAVTHWMEEHEYASVRQMLGSMSLRRVREPEQYERANYMHILQSWTPA